MCPKRDKIVIVDIEATCWEGNRTPPGEQSEIIEIGVCLLALETYALTGKRSILVRPERSKVSPFCTGLTTLTQQQVDNGLPFHQACKLLSGSYDSLSRLWVSWGNYDLRMFTEQCRSRNTPYPFSGCHANSKRLFADLHGDNQIGLARALERAGLTMEGTHHRGDDDAWNIGRLLVYMLKQFGRSILDGAWRGVQA